MEFEQLLQLVESNAKSIEALSNQAANARQELKETRVIVNSSAKAILALAEQSTESR
jgi:AmiR/NasT family two-component response regulator